MSETDAEVEGRKGMSEAAKEAAANYNVEMRKDKLRRKVVRAHEWRVQVWAQMELKIRSDNAALEAMEAEPIDLFEPQFGDDEALQHYASMTLSK